MYQLLPPPSKALSTETRGKKRSPVKMNPERRSSVEMDPERRSSVEMDPERRSSVEMNLKGIATPSVHIAVDKYY